MTYFAFQFEDENTSEELVDVFKLRNPIFAVAAVLDEQWPVLVVFLAGVRRIQLVQLAEYCAPRGDLLFGIVDASNRFSTEMTSRDTGK